VVELLAGAANAARLASPQYYQDFAPVPDPGVGTVVGGAAGATVGGLLGAGVAGGIYAGLKRFGFSDMTGARKMILAGAGIGGMAGAGAATVSSGPGGIGGLALTGAAIGGVMGKSRGALAGGILGAAVGTAGYASLASNRGTQGLRTPYGGNRTLNPETLDYDVEFNNPGANARNVSLANARALNSQGDIVLGMHNRRRG
jgi:hypothetical protein